MPNPQIIALDFDGVICDGLIEYFETSKLTYYAIWGKSVSIDNLAESFYRLRPVIEVGWEMPVLVRALIKGISEQEIADNWPQIAGKIVTEEQLDKNYLGKTLDSIRDEWINKDVVSWLSLHRFYPLVIPKLSHMLSTPTKLYIVTTKEGRFVKELLQQEGIVLAEGQIIGKECQQPKHQTLRQLKGIVGCGNDDIIFVEDRLKTLELVLQQPDLQGVSLYLAAWGYNTEKTRASIAHNPHIHLLSLAEFIDEF